MIQIPDKKYKTIVIDPPWDIRSVGDGHNLKFQVKDKLPYGIQSDDELKVFPLNDFAADDCQLFLWITHTTLPLAMELLQIWGFKYHCIITWDKTKGVVICGVNRRTEMVLYAYKGKQDLKQHGVSLPTYFRENSTIHSRKPQLFYQMLCKSTPEPRIDIFARRKHQGFDAWGDQVENVPTIENWQ